MEHGKMPSRDPRRGQEGLLMRCSAAVIVTLGCLLIAGSVAAASDDTDPTDPHARRDAVVALVLGQDPRFANVPDFERQARIASSNFDFSPLLSSDYYRVLATLASSYTPWMFDFGYPANWLVEVTLVEACTPFPDGEGSASGTAPWPDPCEWRHSWFYRVEPDDTVTLLVEEGDPEPMPTG